MHAVFLPPTQNHASQPYVLYEMISPDSIVPHNVYCGLVSVGIGQVCTFLTNVYLENSTIPVYQNVYFLSSGEVIKISQGPNNFNMSIIITLGTMDTMPFGGYTFRHSFYDVSTNNSYFTLYAYDDNETQILELGPIVTNQFGTSNIMSNNTLLVAIPGQNASWTLYTYQLPKVRPDLDGGYGNLEINSTNPGIDGTVEPFTDTSINITFNDQVELSSANISIYHTTTNNLRQFIILSNIESLDNSEEGKFSDAVSGTLYLTANATSTFLRLNKSEKSTYISELLGEISIMVPVRLSRLSSNGNYQHINAETPSEQIFISVYVNKPKNNRNERNVSGVFADLNFMIKNKQVTSISYGSKTNDLDPNFGFRPVRQKL
ncbi:15442_t:CDS:2 [Acaulospora colombiana]|uniref:15442_t:CDS:1 n=1 Tax=Acaulospora colombiana TaxID=27376 RepID=A0ACA9K722_9GLOM|nr:15442_t:CDS:2 [Acaulospora colombiana]